jgi:hypothetical protein
VKDRRIYGRADTSSRAEKLYEYTPADAMQWIFASEKRPTYEVLSDEAIIAAVTGAASAKEVEEVKEVVVNFFLSLENT